MLKDYHYWVWFAMKRFLWDWPKTISNILSINKN